MLPGCSSGHSIRGVVFMKRAFLLFPLMAVAIVLISCSGGSSSRTAAALPNVSGPWEIITTSSQNPGYSTRIEVSLQEGQMLVNGAYAPNGEISASSLQMNFVGFTPAGSILFGGNCSPASNNPGNSLSGSISGLASSMNFTYAENGNVFTVTATLDGNGQSIDNGTYTEQPAQAGQSNGGCNPFGSGNENVLDTGTVVGQIVPKLSGIYSGKMCQPLDTLCADNTPDTATATLSESGATLSIDLVLTGADNTSFTLAGPVTGNAFFVQGTFQGQSVAYYGYNSANGLSTPTLYLVNATNSAQTTYAGTLTFQ